MALTVQDAFFQCRGGIIVLSLFLSTQFLLLSLVPQDHELAHSGIDIHSYFRDYPTFSANQRLHMKKEIRDQEDWEAAVVGIIRDEDNDVWIRVRAINFLATESPAFDRTTFFNILKDELEPWRLRLACAANLIVHGEDVALATGMFSRALSSTDQVVRRIAIETAPSATHEIVPALLAFAPGSSDSECAHRIRKAAILLSAQPTPVIVGHLRPLLLGARPLVRASVAAVLFDKGVRDQDVISMLETSLDLSDLDVLAECTTSLARDPRFLADDTRLATALTKCLAHVDPMIRGNAAGTLGDVGTTHEESRSALLSLLVDDDAYPRSASAYALGKLPFDIDTLRALVRATGDPDAEVVAFAFESARDLCLDSRTLPVLEELLVTSTYKRGVRQMAAEAMATWSPVDRLTAADALRRRLAESPSESASLWILYAAGGLGAEGCRMLPDVEAVAADSEASSSLRWEAMRTLERLTVALVSQARQLFEEAMGSDEDEVIRTQAAESLEALLRASRGSADNGHGGR